jgi:kynurenine formamidase
MNVHPGARARPRHAELRDRPGYPDGSSWGLWGADDEIGALNDVTVEHVAAAARLAVDGAVFPLNWSMSLPEPALFGRGPLTRTVADSGASLDDRYDGFFPQRSSQWDALSHFRHPRHGFYGGREPRELHGPHPRNGVDNWARRGIAGRFVLADVGRWRDRVGRPLDPGGHEPVPITDIAATLSTQDVTPQPGDFLLLRFGWIDWYQGLDASARSDLAAAGSGWTATGLRGDVDTVRWLWDTGIVAVVADNPAVEAYPFDPAGASLHADLLALLGVPLGELWYLDELAAHCATDRRYTGLLAAAPLNLPGGTGSPANAIAIK